MGYVGTPETVAALNRRDQANFRARHPSACSRCRIREPRSGMKTCSSCAGEVRDYQLANLGAHRRSWLKRYGITPEQYDTMLASQRGHCAICPTTEPGRKLNFFCVDHDHETGQVRGLLCHACNTALKKHLTPQLLRKAADYVARAAVI